MGSKIAKSGRLARPPYARLPIAGKFNWTVYSFKIAIYFWYFWSILTDFYHSCTRLYQIRVAVSSNWKDLCWTHLFFFISIDLESFSYSIETWLAVCLCVPVKSFQFLCNILIAHVLSGGRNLLKIDSPYCIAIRNFEKSAKI